MGALAGEALFISKSMRKTKRVATTQHRGVLSARREVGGVSAALGAQVQAGVTDRDQGSFGGVDLVAQRREADADGQAPLASTRQRGAPAPAVPYSRTLAARRLPQSQWRQVPGSTGVDALCRH